MTKKKKEEKEECFLLGFDSLIDSKVLLDLVVESCNLGPSS